MLRARLAHYLADFTLLFPQSLPAGDGGLSLGQGVIAAARWLAGELQNGSSVLRLDTLPDAA
ncbi:hypothetical protein ACLK1T_19655 [Escherichia coli]